MEAFKDKFTALLKEYPALLSRLPFVEVTRLDGSSKKGVLVHAETLNPPPGCLRIVSFDEFATEKVTWLCDSSSTTYANELTDVWTRSLRDTRSVTAAAKATTSKENQRDKIDLPAGMFADKKRGIFLSHAAVTNAVKHIDSYRQAKQAEKEAAEQAKAAMDTDGDPSAGTHGPASFMLGSVGGSDGPPCLNAKPTPPSAADIFDDGAAASTGTKRAGSGSGAGAGKSAKATADATAGAAARAAPPIDGVAADPPQVPAQVRAGLVELLPQIEMLASATKAPGEV